MVTETQRSPRSRLLITTLMAGLGVAGLAALSTPANAADRPNCEPITKVCNNPLLVPRQAAAREKPSTDATTSTTKRNRCEPITKVCIHKMSTKGESPTSAPQQPSAAHEPSARQDASAATEKKKPSATSKRHRCEPPTKVCIYR